LLERTERKFLSSEPDFYTFCFFLLDPLSIYVKFHGLGPLSRILAGFKKKNSQIYISTDMLVSRISKCIFYYPRVTSQIQIGLSVLKSA
jgi:hypothetical protein